MENILNSFTFVNSNMLFSLHLIHLFAVHRILPSYKCCYSPRSHHREDFSTSYDTGLPEYGGIARSMWPH